MPEDLRKDTYINGVRHIISGAVRWHTDNIQGENDFSEPVELISPSLHDEFVKTKSLASTITWMKIPETIDERINILLTWLVKKLELVGVPKGFEQQLIQAVCFAQELHEADTLLFHLKKMNFIDCTVIGTKKYAVSMTVDGMREYEKLKSVNKNSVKGFIAMKFGDEYERLKTALVEAVKSAGYEPIVINDYTKTKPESSVTIDSRIISEIKTKLRSS